MAKKQSKKETKIKFEEKLPQNILPIGERVEEDKKIYISQAVYKEIHRFTKNKTTNESGGILVGNIIEEFGKTNIVIQGFVEAKFAEGTPTTLKFTHETWDYVHGEIDKKYDNGVIVGWIHTHPDFGIFLSEYDKFIQENFFKEDNQIAYVVDPIQHIEGFYFWINGKIERCKGFYIFDKTGEKIEIEEDKAVDKQNKTTAGYTQFVSTMILSVALVIVVIAFAVISMNLSNRMKILEQQQENLVDSANQSISNLQLQNSSLNQEITDLQNQLEELQPDEDTEDDADEIENAEGEKDSSDTGSDDLETENEGTESTEDADNE